MSDRGEEESSKRRRDASEEDDSSSTSPQQRRRRRQDDARTAVVPASRHRHNNKRSRIAEGPSRDDADDDTALVPSPPPPQQRLPVAPDLRSFLAEGGSRRYRPRAEWVTSRDDEDALVVAPPAPVYHSARAAARAVLLRAPPRRRPPPPRTSSSSYHRREEEEEGERGDVYDDDDDEGAGHLFHPRDLHQQVVEDPTDEADGDGPRGDDDDDNNNNADNAPWRVELDAFDRLIRQHYDVDDDERRPRDVTTTTDAAAAVDPRGDPAESALVTAIREHATEAALALIQAGASVHGGGRRGRQGQHHHHHRPPPPPPLVLAAQKGNVAVVRALLRGGAHPATASPQGGSTALLQAAHFGHEGVVRLLLLSSSSQHGGTAPPLAEVANANGTTPLMRAAQEGHAGVCADLLRAGGAAVNRRNRCHMSALMLAAQRGHDAACRCLLRHGADVDARTHQDSTSLLLACKRGHVRVVRRLVTAGAELWVTDTRGRTARDVVQRRWALVQRHGDARDDGMRRRCRRMLELLDSTAQRHLMRLQGRKRRLDDLMLHWHLLQQGRATVAVPLTDKPVYLSHVPALLDRRATAHHHHRLPYPLGSKSTQALLRTMLLPAPLVQLVAAFLPLPHLWERSIGMLTRRATVHPDETVRTALDLVDEILEEGGFVEACDAACVPPPPPHPSWRAWKAVGRRHGQAVTDDDDTTTTAAAAATAIPTATANRPNVTLATVPAPSKPDQPTLVDLRRAAGFLTVLQTHYRRLAPVLQGSCAVPAALCAQLARTSDLASLVRRMTAGVHVDSTVAMDLVMLVSRLCGWYWRHSENTGGGGGQSPMISS